MSYTKHQTTIHSRFQWLMDPANEITRAKDAEDVRGSCRQSWHQPASSRSHPAGLTPCTRFQLQAEADAGCSVRHRL